MTTTKLTQPLKIHGGKGAFGGKLAKWIISLMPNRDTWELFSEPYLGGGSVALHMDPVGISEIHNDIDGELANFWVTLQGKNTFKWFRELCEKTPFSQHEWEKARRKLADGGEHSSVLRAWWFFIHCRQSREGKMKHFVTPTGRTRRGMNENVSAWLTAIEGLPAVHARVKRMEVRNMDAVEFIKEVDHPRRVFYCDPPYLHETRASTKDYKHEMTLGQHAHLLKCLSGIKGRFLLSGYRSEMYDEFAADVGWSWHEFKIPNCASSGKKKRVMVECVWTNY